MCLSFIWFFSFFFWFGKGLTDVIVKISPGWMIHNLSTYCSQVSNTVRTRTCHLLFIFSQPRHKNQERVKACELFKICSRFSWSPLVKQLTNPSPGHLTQRKLSLVLAYWNLHHHHFKSLSKALDSTSSLIHQHRFEKKFVMKFEIVVH